MMHKAKAVVIISVQNTQLKSSTM